MKQKSLSVLLLAANLCLSSGCGKPPVPTNAKATIPAQGKVLVDGQPAASLSVECLPAAGLDKANPTLSSGMTDKDGVFKLGTYKSGDGVPEGDYVLIFQWGTLNTFKHTFEGDKLNGKYADPKTSEVKFSAKAGQPVQLGDIKLTTQ